MWKYQDVLNTGLTVLLVILAGYVSVALTVLTLKDVAPLNGFVFKFALPALVLNGIGLKTNLYSSEIWRFVAVFLILRALTLAGSVAYTVLVQKGGVGDCMVHWVATTWISTAILGVPVIRAALGTQYAQLGIIAGISSFIFQLPVMLFFFEVHRWRQERVDQTPPALQHHTPAQAGAQGDLAIRCGSTASDKDDIQLTAMGPNSQSAAAAEDFATNSSNAATISSDGYRNNPVQQAAAGPKTLWVFKWEVTTGQLKGLGLKLLHNHVLWGIFIGFVLSLSTIGWKYLNPGTPPLQPNCRYIPAAGFIAYTLDWLGRCTEPVALFATGMWMYRRSIFPCGILTTIAYMFFKLIVLPLLAIACCFMLDVRGATGRAAVIIASLPVSLAAFAVSKEYSIGEDVMISNVTWGTVLMLPTVIAWLAVMDAVDLFVPVPVKAVLPPAIPHC